MSQESPQPPSLSAPTFRQEIKDLLLTCSGQMKLLYRDKPDNIVATVNETLAQINATVQKLEVDRTRLLPLAPGTANEELANVLALLLTDDIAAVEDAARGALLILTGIQAFQDSGGDYRVIEQAWRPAIIARDLLTKHGDNAWQVAAKAAGEARGLDRHLVADIYERVALMLAPDINKEVDNPS